MSIFKGWENHVERLTENWNASVSKNDTVVIAGDISWANTIEEARPDFEFINNSLNGRKIILKGNHDFWWSTAAKNNIFLKENGFENISFLHNNAFLVGNTAVCGTRGWCPETIGTDIPQKLQKREAIRLELSVKQAIELGGKEICAFLHYPPIYGNFENYEIIDVLQKYKIKRCFYGHLHGAAHKYAVSGIHYGIEFTLVSADFVGFKPIKVKNS